MYVGAVCIERVTQTCELCVRIAGSGPCMYVQGLCAALGPWVLLLWGPCIPRTQMPSGLTSLPPLFH